ncbi:site-specific integrase [Psychromonas sp. MME2]|uniref:tyrosine-type recombinase/integrase n=1 Tax=Psychromonas sp. MME2 TaxID=3231033 RepID=UPI00339D06D5
MALLLVDDDLANSLTNHILTTLTFSDAVKKFLAQDLGKDSSKHQRLNYWVSIFADKTVGKITRQQIKDELKLLSNDKALATLNRYKAAIGALYSYLSDEFDIDYNPVKGIRQYAENNGRTRFLTAEEISRLFITVKESTWGQLYLLVLMALTTGARRTEMLTLKWDNINFKSKTAHLPITKNGDQRILTLTADVIAELMKYRNISGYVFPHPREPKRYFRNFDIHWRVALSDAKISDFRFHDLRHTCASLLAMNGASLLEIAQVLGHKSITMTQRYSHLCVSHKAKLTDRVFGGIVNG